MTTETVDFLFAFEKIGIFTPIITANMRIFLKALFFGLILFFESFHANSQDVIYKCFVTDYQHHPLPGVSLHVIGDHGTASDSEGKIIYKLKLPALITFSCLGYKSLEFNISSVKPGYDTIYLDEDTKTIGDVVVTASKRGQNINEVTQSMEVMKQDFMLQTQTTQVQKALEKLPGIVVQKDEVSIRGASGFSYGAGSRVMVLLDDMPILSGDASDPKWDYYPIENISQVEILKGASSALYGSSAMEGVINMKTTVAADTPFTMVKVYGGFYDHPTKIDTGFWGKQTAPRMLSGVTVAHREIFGPIKLTASATFSNDDGYRKGDNVQIKRAYLFLEYSPPKNNRLVIDFSANGMEDNGQLFLFFGNVSDPYVPYPGTTSIYNYYRWHTDLSLKYYLTDRSKIIIRTRYFTTINDNNTNQSSTAHVWFNEFQYQNQLFKSGSIQTDLTAGLTYTKTQNISDSLYGFHGGNNSAAYLQIDQKFGKVTLSLGGRIEANKVDSLKLDYAPVFRAGVNYHIGALTYLRASYGQGFRYPSVAELFAHTVSGAINIIPDPTLNAEKGWSSEFGVRQVFGFWGIKGYVDVSGFLSEYQNMIEYIFNYYPPDPNSKFNPKYLGFKGLNIGNTLIEGYEISTAMAKQIGPLNITLYGGYTMVLPYNRDSLNKHLAESYHQYLSFRHRDMVKANLDVIYKKFGLGFYSFYNSPFLNMDQFFIGLIKGLSQNNYWMPYSAGFVADLRVSYKISKAVNLSLFAKNVFILMPRGIIRYKWSGSFKFYKSCQFMMYFSSITFLTSATLSE